MRLTNSDQKNFLLELHSLTNGDPNQQISMMDIGQKLGLDKNSTSSLSEDLMIEELVELKTLSGGIGITPLGVETLQKEGLISSSTDSAPLTISNGPFISTEDRSVIEQVLEGIRSIRFTSEAEFQYLEELVIDLKTIDVQLLSPRPKNVIILAVLHSVQKSLDGLGESAWAEKLSTLLKNSA